MRTRANLDRMPTFFASTHTASVHLNPISGHQFLKLLYHISGPCFLKLVYHISGPWFLKRLIFCEISVTSFVLYFVFLSLVYFFLSSLKNCINVPSAFLGSDFFQGSTYIHPIYVLYDTYHAQHTTTCNRNRGPYITLIVYLHVQPVEEPKQGDIHYTYYVENIKNMYMKTMW